MFYDGEHLRHFALSPGGAQDMLVFIIVAVHTATRRRSNSTRVIIIVHLQTVNDHMMDLYNLEWLLECNDKVITWL